MPYTKRTGLYYPKKGTKEAREWAKEMRSFQKRKTYKENLVVQCAWCGRKLGTKGNDKDTNITHTICGKCFRREMKRVKREKVK